MTDTNKTQPGSSVAIHDIKRPAFPRFISEDLFKGGKMVVIEHAGREYQLRVTSGNKLILTA